jgi:tetratricopeptide (TPR) repeat protein
LLEYFGQLIKNEPARAELYAGRANVLARAGQWHDAAADLTKAIELRPPAEMAWCRLAPLLAATGDAVTYQRYGRNALEQFAKPGNPNIAEEVMIVPAYACAIGDGQSVFSLIAGRGCENERIAQISRV